MPNDSEWGYSTNALNVINKFHESSFVVYVEGIYDIPFWEVLFSKTGISGYYIDAAGGIDELKKLMTQICQENARLIVACDSEYSMILNNIPQNDKIISTFGHSMENTIFCPFTINSIISRLSYKPDDRIEKIRQWFDIFCACSRILIIYDIARAKYQKCVKVIGDNCSRFLQNHHSSYLDIEKIASYLLSINDNFIKEELDECEQLLAKSGYEIRYTINGHFIVNGIVNLIKNSVYNVRGKRPTLPLDNLYALAIDGCKGCNNSCQEFPIVKQRIEKAVDSLKLL